jgi:hypothetical protein
MPDAIFDLAIGSTGKGYSSSQGVIALQFLGFRDFTGPKVWNP